ncbi:MAG TPA: hypothetical protein VGW34_08145 [Allosphingosinicella sp.]|nr:hypothetical protein [Allosphingosinicella sp.]
MTGTGTRGAARLAAAALAVLALPAAAQATTVAEFLARAEALEKKGAMALFAKDYKALQAELQAAGKALRAEQKAARAAGRAPATCMPAKAGVKSTELLAYFRAIPPARRGASVKDGLAGLMRRKYPCPA